MRNGEPGQYMACYGRLPATAKRWQIHVDNDIPHSESGEHFLLDLSESFRLAYGKQDISVRAETKAGYRISEEKNSARLVFEVCSHSNET